MAKLHRTYTLHMRTLTPLHIGTGNTLRRDYDYVTYRGGTWVIHNEALADMLIGESESDFQALVDGTPAGDLLRKDDFQEGNPLFRYVLTGEPKTQSRGAEVQELIKNVWDEPYIPGSSIKGAIRTAVGAYGLLDHTLNVHELGDRAKFAAQPIEEKVLYGNYPKRGQKPNYDLMRAVQVSDSTPDPDKKLRLLNVNVVTHRKTQSPIELEAIPNDSEFIARLTLDGYMRSATPIVTEAKRGQIEEAAIRDRLGFSKDQRSWINNIAIMMNNFSLLRIEQEIERWKERDGAGTVRSLYEQLHQIANYHVNNGTKDEFLMQLGWGTGWDGKTFSEFLRRDEGKFARVVGKYGKTLVRQGNYQVGDKFPKSRRMMMNGDNPYTPLGWVLVKMERDA